MSSWLYFPRTTPLPMLERPGLNKLQQSKGNSNGKRTWQRNRITNIPSERRIFCFHIPYRFIPATRRQSTAWGIQRHFSSNISKFTACVRSPLPHANPCPGRQKRKGLTTSQRDSRREGTNKQVIF